jgi:hypothetical protein
MKADLSGDWMGNYSYPGELEPVPFLATLVESNGNLTGETREPGQTPEMGAIAHALLQGSRSGAQVRFTKMYDTIEDEPILYEGTVDETATEIHGSWTIVDEWSGSFLMRRAIAAEEEVEAEEEVPA